MSSMPSTRENMLVRASMRQMQPKQKTPVVNPMHQMRSPSLNRGSTADVNIDAERKCEGLTRSKLEVIEPVLGDHVALLEALLVHASDDGRVRVAVLLDVHGVLVEADIVQVLNHLELVLSQG